MKWRRGVGRGQIEDRRGRGGFGRGGGFPIGARGGIGGGLGLVLVLVALLFGGGVVGGGGGGAGIDEDPRLEPFPNMPAGDGGLAAGADPDAELRDFVAFVVADVQDSWARSFAEAGRRYEPTKLVLFTEATTSGCGPASAQTGPFYCPADRKVYLDLGFFRELRGRFGAPGDFAQAYVIAHEFGHHVQNVLGISGDVQRVQRDSPEEANELSVRLELQADCLAGVWAYSAYEEELLERGDLEEGLGAAAAVGDDRLQRQAGADINPETWTHGSSEQRVEWFGKGYESGDPNACDTFSGEV
jgi:predicted metalloprotease